MIVALKAQGLGVWHVVFLMSFAGCADSEGCLWLELSGFENSSNNSCANNTQLFGLDPGVVSFTN